jgi:hypothetical protein
MDNLRELNEGFKTLKQYFGTFCEDTDYLRENLMMLNDKFPRSLESLEIDVDKV